MPLLPADIGYVERPAKPMPFGRFLQFVVIDDLFNAQRHPVFDGWEERRSVPTRCADLLVSRGPPWQS